MLSKEEFLAITTHKLDPYRRQGVELLRLSKKEALMHPIILFNFQKGVLSNIQKLEEDLDKVEKGSNDFIAIKHLIRCFRQLVDGMALRLLYFNPHAYRILAENRQSGRISKREGLSDELKSLENIANDGKYAILNDLTNFIRLGDITIINEGRIELMEIKAGKKQKTNKDLKLSEQEEKLKIVEKSVNESVAMVRGEKATMRFIPINAKSYKGKVMSLIKKINKNGFAFYDVDEFIRIYGVNAEVCAKKKLKLEESFKEMPDFPEEDEIITGNNTDFSYSDEDEFIRGSFPPSAFYIPCSMIADLMYCRVVIYVNFNFTKFIQAFRDKGFEVEVNLESSDIPIGEKYNKKTAPFEKSGVKSKIIIRKNDRNDNWFMVLPSNLIPRITHEYLKPETAFDLVKYYYEHHGTPQVPRPGLHISIFENHMNMWQ